MLLCTVLKVIWSISGFGFATQTLFTRASEPTESPLCGQALVKGVAISQKKYKTKKSGIQFWTVGDTVLLTLISSLFA